MVVVDKFTKETHFILVKTTHKEINIAYIYMNEVFRLQRVPKEIVSHKYLKFTSNFLEGFVQGIWDKFKC
jgi:hypothetical protein